MSFPRYPSYKDSGVEWLGEVPVHWGVLPLKRTCHVLPSNVDKKSHDGETPVLLCNYTDVYHNEAIVEGMDFMAATASAAQITKFTLRAGDTIITKDSETADDIAISAHVPADLPGVVCGYHLSMVRPMPETDGTFVKRLFDSTFVKSCVAVRANGLTRVGLGQYEIDNLKLPFPPLPEQTQIAAFLDRETAKIDGLVVEQRRLMELLKEKRQAVISHAVTKGLSTLSRHDNLPRHDPLPRHAPLSRHSREGGNPEPTAAEPAAELDSRLRGNDGAVPMKSSGIEWLGDVPAHWELKRLRFVANLNPSKSEVSNLDRATVVSFLPMASIGEDGTLNLESEKQIRELESGYTYFRDGDVTIAKITPCFENGKGALMTGLVNGIGFGTTELIVARPNPDQVDGTFLHFLFISTVFRDRGESHMYGAGGQKRVPDEFVRNFATAFPPLAEQIQIAAFLDTELAKLDTLTAEAQRAIDLLQERRTALISAAVTGQIDVRQLTEKQAA